MNKKEYTIQINGITTSVKDVTSLEKALQSLDKTAKNTTTLPKGTSSGISTKFLTDEEKAVKKLAETQKKLNQVNSEINRAQLEATRTLREKTKEVAREIQLNQLAEGSIAQMGMQLTNLRKEYYELSEAERENVDIGGQMLTKIQALDEKYKGLKESTGDFRDSVGNYEKALSSLGKLDKGLKGLEKNVNGVAAAFGNSNTLLNIFGSVTEGTSKLQSELAKIIAVVSLAQKLNTAVTGKNSIAKAFNNALSKTQILQENARAIAINLSTKSTIAATAAQRVFNAVARANPYVLLAMALVSVVGALAAFISKTKEASDSQGNLNDKMSIHLDLLEGQAQLIKLATDERIKNTERELRLAKARNAGVEETRRLERKLLAEREYQNKKLLKHYDEEFKSLDDNKRKLAEFQILLAKVREAQKRGENKLYVDVDLNGSAKKVNVEEAINTIQQNIDRLNKSITVSVKLKNDSKDLRAEAAEAEARYKQEDIERAKREKEEAQRRAEEAKRKKEEAARLAKEMKAIELDSARALEDAKSKLTLDTLEKQKEDIRRNYARQIEDLKLKLKEENKYTLKARQNINKQIVALNALMKKELEDLDKKSIQTSIEIEREKEETTVKLIKDNNERKIKEIKINYDKQIEALQERLNKETSLTKEQRESLNDIIKALELRRIDEINSAEAESLKKRADLELQTAEYVLKEVDSKIEDVVSRRKEGIFEGVIDVEETKKNAETANSALEEYIDRLKVYLLTLKQANDKILEGMEEGSAEYKNQLQKYESELLNTSSKIKGAQKKQEENTKKSTKATVEHYREMFAKIAKYADLGVQAINSVIDTLNMGIQASLDSLNEQLETTNKHYEKAKECREKYAKEVENIEQKIQNATGSTADAFREQLQDAMHNRDEAIREEQRQAREKEKLEAEIAKKEKQQKKNDLISKIAMGIANTAQGVTAALSKGLPGIILASIIGAMGAAQVGIMTRQLSKLAKGGPIIGPSHDNGGVNILIDGKPSYEAQGGEFMVNDKSYSNNKALTEFLNNSPQTLTATDLVGIVPGFDALPVAVNDAPGNDRIVEAINEIEFNPVVSVTDIINVTDEVTAVRDLAGV